MIDTNSLRRGNLITAMGGSYKNKPLKVSKIGENYIGFEKLDDYLLPANCGRIKLTDEWFKKLGFLIDKEQAMDNEIVYAKLETHTTFFIVQKSFVAPNMEYFAGMPTPIKDVKILLTKVEYVDQLQNIYYFYTGKELTI